VKKTIIVGLLISTSIAVLAQQVPVTSDHKPNEHTLACLEAPTRDCAFTAALQTVINEEFGIERAKVLIGIARSMIVTNQKEQAIQTLMLALDEARSVNLSLVTREKITVIAPLLARAGDTASALALVGELQNPSIKDLVLLKIASEAGRNGHIADVHVALRQANNQTRAFWRELVILTQAPRAMLSTVDLAEVGGRIREIERPERRYRGLIQLAIIADHKGDAGERNALLTEADELFLSVVGIHQRAGATADRAYSMFKAGMDPAFVEASYELALTHGNRLRGSEVLASFADKVGVIEAASGNIDKALRRLEVFQGLPEKAKYLSKLHAGRDKSLLAAEVRGLLTEIAGMEGAYDRDLVRLTLLEGALVNEDSYLAQHIVQAIEDDDNQAYALALMAPLLE